MSVDNKTLADIRSEVCNTTVKWMLAFGTVGVALSLARILETGWRPAMGLHVALWLIIAALHVFENRIHYAVRAGTLVGAMFLIALAGNLTVGPVAGNAFYASSAILAAVFFGEIGGIAVVVLSGVAIAGHYLGLK